MSAGQIVLIAISGLGVIHGVFLALLLWSYDKGQSITNKLLSLLLIILSVRIGKSVFLAFIDELDVKIIFSGLSMIMAIGPLYLLLVKSILNKSFSFEHNQIGHFIPALLGFILGILLNQNHLDTLPIYLFAILFFGYYLHFLIYIIVGYRQVVKHKNTELSKEAFQFLRLLFFGLLALWVVYVLNLFDEDVPYIVGPILYSVTAYSISYVIFKKDYIQKLGQNKYKSNPISDQQIDRIYSKVLEAIERKKQYKDSEISLKSMSSEFKVSPQILSLVINKKSEKNFNSFINTYRINEAKNMLQHEEYTNLTIAAIAFEVGFSSISSFNTAFKKSTNITPAIYRSKSTK